MATFVVYETLKVVIAQEISTRLGHLPFAILRAARRRLPEDLRQVAYDEEWMPELWAIIHRTEGLPITRFYRGVDFAISLFFAARSIAGDYEAGRKREVVVSIRVSDLFPGKTIIWEHDMRLALDRARSEFAESTDPRTRSDLQRRIELLQLHVDAFDSLPD
ncbi:hypothetical protein ACFFX1_55245 [Dactylosporangium sucinum]|uniref:hypothetical protein n=1 Tax=Dactylosporangium sucinum TaxID=1424081 RepID=UPI00167CBC47|nr:hypothetical protein [Dactylosporangium sucinum]